MNNIITYIKRYTISLLTIAVIWYLSFFTPPSTKLDHVIGIDKVVHFGMYFFLTAVMLWESRKQLMPHNPTPITHNPKLITIVVLIPIIMSGLIEVLQEYCTSGRRSGDIFDFLANTLGALTAWGLWRKFSD